MSNCANLINRLFSEVCFLKEREAKTTFMLDLLQINQAIFQRLDTTVYIVPSNASTATVIGLPVSVQANYVTKDEKAAATVPSLITLGSISPDCIVYSTKNLFQYGVRTETGFFDFTKTVPITVLDVNVEILNNVDSAAVYAALKACVDTTSTSTLSCAAYDALVAFLARYGVKSVNVFQAACIYKNLEDIVLNNAEATRSLGLAQVEDKQETADATEEVVEAAQPFEPAQPSEPSDLISNVYVRQLQDTTLSESVSNNESIELKLKALLEATETTEQTE